jgi:circadian clock protein KaiC
VSQNSMVRKVQILKMRGLSPQPGRHTVRISEDGIQIFPRVLKPIETSQGLGAAGIVSTGVSGIDEMLGGGLPVGNSLLVAGPAGSGKTTLAIQFIAEGLKLGEPGVIAIFEETTTKYLDEAKGFGFHFEAMIRQGVLEIVSIRPLDLSTDETLYAIQTAIIKNGARRLVLDSITGLESALAPTSKDDLYESLCRLLGTLTSAGITTVITVDAKEAQNEARFTPHAISFLAQDIILQRYVEREGQLRTVMTVMKTRGRPHSPDLRTYEISETGLVVGERLTQY